MRKYRKVKKGTTKSIAKSKPVNRKPVNSAKPFCYVTKTGKTITQKQLDMFAIKEDSKQIKDRFSKMYGGSHGLKGPPYQPETFSQLLEINTYHARCCDAKAKDTAGLGYSLRSLVDNPNEAVHNELEEFFDSQKPPITVLLTRAQKDFEAIGYSAIEMTRVGGVPTGKPKKLVHMPAHTIRIHESGNKFAQVRAGKRKWFKLINYGKDVNCDTGEEFDLGTLTPEKRATEILWNTDYSSQSDYYGLPSIMPAIGAIYGDLSRRDYNIAFFSNYGVPAYAIFISGNFDPGKEDEEGKNDLTRAIEDNFDDIIENPHANLVMTIPTKGPESKIDIEIKPLSVDVKEASFRLYRKDNRDEVIIAHGVPGYRIGVTEGGALAGNFATEATEIYKMSVVEPRQTVLEQLINQEIIWHESGFNTKDWEYKFADIDTKDEAHEKEIIGFLFDHGAMTIRNIIQHYVDRFGLQDDPDDPLLDIRFVAGRPISGEFVNTTDFTNTVKALQKRLIDMAVKDESGNGHKDSNRVREVLRELTGLKTNT